MEKNLKGRLFTNFWKARRAEGKRTLLKRKEFSAYSD